MDRSELLSFYITRGITSLSQIKNKIVSEMAIATNGDLRLIYNDLSEVRVPRKSTTGQSTHIKSINVVGELNTLTITDSNDVVYQLGNLSTPAVANAIVGEGAYLGYLDGKHVFKPLVFSNQFQNSDGLFGLTTATGGARIGSKYIRAQSLDHSFPTSTNIWRNRPFTTLETNMSGVTLNALGISVPAGKYYAKGTAPSYQTNNSSIRLVNTEGVIVDGGVAYSRNVISDSETQNPIAGCFELLEDDQVVIQTMHQNSHSRTSWGRTFLELWKLS